MGGRAVLGHAMGHTHTSAVAAEEPPVRQAGGPGDHLHPPGDLGLRKPKTLFIANHAIRPDGVQGSHCAGGD